MSTHQKTNQANKKPSHLLTKRRRPSRKNQLKKVQKWKLKQQNHPKFNLRVQILKKRRASKNMTRKKTSSKKRAAQTRKAPTLIHLLKPKELQQLLKQAAWPILLPKNQSSKIRMRTKPTKMPKIMKSLQSKMVFQERTNIIWIVKDTLDQKKAAESWRLHRLGQPASLRKKKS